MKRVTVVVLTIGAFGFVSCNGGPTGNLDPTGSSTDAEYSGISQDSLKQALEDIYSQGNFQYLAEDCFFSEEASGAGSSPFRCGEILVGIMQGVERARVAELLRTVSGSIVKDRIDLSEWSWVVAQVPIGSEKAAILALLSSEDTRYAALNFVGPAVLP